MEKLLHERLREWWDNDQFWDAWISPESRHELFYKFADEIERYYIPRPRFEDGEPVQFGDDVVYARIQLGYPIDEIMFRDDGICEVFGNGNSISIEPSVETFKRPQPKVLDADGVEIKVGDTVWDKQGNRLEVKEIDPSDDPEYREHSVWCGAYRCGCKWWKIASQLTHKEPDSLERILDDATKDPRAYYNEHIGHDVGLRDDAYVIERFAQHLIGRTQSVVENSDLIERDA